MDRRGFLGAAGAAGLVGAMPESSTAALTCGPFVPPGVQECQVGIDSAISPIYAFQQQSEWCWAACIEAVFRYYGHPVPQMRIVAETWGAIVNLPGQPQQILFDLNRPWQDDFGNTFSVGGDVLTANPITAAQDLAGNMPLIIGSMGHAMVLSGLDYVRDSVGRGQVRAAFVHDPMPGVGARVLTPQEWYSAMFLARIRVLG